MNSQEAGKTRILLVIPPVIYARQPSIGSAYLIAVLEEAGYDVKILDLNLSLPEGINDGDDAFWGLKENSEKFFDAFRDQYERWVRDIADYGADIVGFQVWHTSEYSSLRLAEMIKSLSPETFIMFGGVLCSIKPEELISHPFVDAVVYGEGEDVMKDIAGSYAAGKFGVKIPGCIVRYRGELKNGGLREEIEDLDKLPFPVFSQFRMDEYLLKNHIPISFGRGCRWRCGFCNVFKLWKNSAPAARRTYTGRSLSG